MYLLTYLAVGVVTGWLASLIMESKGWEIPVDYGVGILGALVGGFIFDFIGNYILGFWDSVGMSIIGSSIFLFVLSMFPRSHGTKQLRH